MEPVKSFIGCSQEAFNELTAGVAQCQSSTPDRIRAMLATLKGQYGGFAVDQLTHCLQTATLAQRGGADDETVFVALCHDLGKAISWINHGAIAAEILKPFVSERAYWLLFTHQDFQGRFYFQLSGQDPDTYLKYKGHPYFDLGIQLSAWDAAAFDPDYDTLPLSAFEHLIDEYTTEHKGVLKPEIHKERITA